MNMPRTKAGVVLVLMVLALAGAHAWRPKAHLADTRPKIELSRLFPKQIGEWAVDENVPVQLVSPDTQALLSKIYNQTLSRTYINRFGERIMLSVAYGGDQSDGTKAHRPEVCYPAQGFQILRNEVARLQLPTQTIPVRQLVAQQGARVEPITYWMTVGELVTTSGTEMKLAQLSYSTRGMVPDGMLVRVSSIGAETTKAYELQAKFIADMSRAAPEVEKALVFGKQGR